MIVDALLLISLFVALHFIKLKYPNFLFFPKGAAMFLPPEINANTQVKPKKKKEKIDQEVSVVKIEYEHVKEYPFTNQFSRVQTTTVGLTLFFIIRYLLSFIYEHQSLFPFYTTSLILIYTVKLGLDTFFMTNYSRKNCFLIALGINVVFYFFFVGFDGVEGVIDKQLKLAVVDYIKHLEIVFNRQITFLTHKTVLITVFIINFFIIIATIPSIIKFGNWYAKTLKETSYEEEDPTLMAAKREGAEQKDIKDQEQRLRQASKKIILKLNIYLISMLAVQFLSHRFVHTVLDESIVFLLRTIFMGVCVLMICATMSNAIEFNGSFAYKYVLQFFQTDDTQKRTQLRKRIAPYIYYIWYHYFQFLIRILIPVLLFFLVFNWKYLSLDKEIIKGTLAERQLNSDIECPIFTDQLEILQNLYKCPLNRQATKLQQKFFLNGIIQSIPKTLQSPAVQSNIQKYGLITRDLMIQFWQQLFWYSSLSIYLMTVIYILFLRKTVYDI